MRLGPKKQRQRKEAENVTRDVAPKKQRTRKEMEKAWNMQPEPWSPKIKTRKEKENAT